VSEVEIFQTTHIFIDCPSHGSHEGSSHHTGNKALEVSFVSVFTVYILDDIKQVVELMRVELHLCFEDIKRLSDDRGQETSTYSATEVAGRRRK